MKTKFYIREGSQKNCTLLFEFRNGKSSRLRASTNFIINSKTDWDLKKHRMKLPSSTINAKLINAKLAEFENLFNDLLFRQNIKHISDESVKEIFDEVFKTKKQKAVGKLIKIENEFDSNKDFIAYYEWFLQYYSKNNSPNSKKILSKGTLNTFRSVHKVIKAYMKQAQLETLYFEDINRSFYNGFIDYLTNEKKYTKNYIGTVIQKLKTVMGYAYDEDKHSNLEYKKNYFSKVTEVINHPYLNIEELTKIEKLVLEDEELNTARDIFLIGCNTGLRISDLLNFIRKPEFIEQEGIKFIKIKQSKTSNDVVIPINSVIKRILKKRNGNLPSYLHQNKINELIKSICKRAKINETYKFIRTEGGNQVEYCEPKYKFICTHTARRSFCTNAYFSGIPPHDIMAISGHKTEKIFFNYIKVEKQLNAIRISKHAFLQ